HRPATEITMALRVPIFENDPGPLMAFQRAPRMGSPGPSAVFFTPRWNSFHGTARVAPPARTRTISASYAANTGSASPAGDAVPRLPPTVPRLRIWGDPTVREACASATNWESSS